ncbi:hypothetical protein B0H13DRAFT_2503235 [Mycena leptocephala]|nr:hypothetical protein B0H13DRAFT_2503235 [Mycena leptocephala]
MTIAFIVESCEITHQFFALKFPVRLGYWPERSCLHHIVSRFSFRNFYQNLYALRSQREGVRIFKNVLTVHLPVNVGLGIWLLVFIFQQESLKGQLKAAAVTLVSIIWGIESVALVTTAQWLVSEIQRDTEKKDVIELQQKPSPYLPSNPIGERHYWDFNLSEIQI